jgi:hypothetical protein
MEKRNKQLAFLLTAIVLAIVLSSFWLKRRSFDSVDTSIFKVDDLATIDSVMLEAPGRKVALKFDGTRWMVNDRYRADTKMVEVFFATLAQIVPRRPVSENMRDSVAGLLSSDGTRVTLFAAGERKKEFYAGGNNAKSEAWFYSPEEGPYVMAIPGYRVYASGVFELDEGGWRDKQVFRFNQRNFKKLALTFTRDQASSFEISYTDEVFNIPGLTEADTTKIFDFLDAASLLKAEELVKPGDNVWVDSLLTRQPSFTIDVTDISGRTAHLTVYPPLPRKRQVVGTMGDEAALFSKSDIIKLAKKKSYFAAPR